MKDLRLIAVISKEKNVVDKSSYPQAGLLISINHRKVSVNESMVLYKITEPVRALLVFYFFIY